MLKIRKATVEDADSVRELFRETIISVNEKDYDEKQIDIWASGSEDKTAWERKITEQHFLIAEIDSKTVGFSSITDEGILILCSLTKIISIRELQQRCYPHWKSLQMKKSWKRFGQKLVSLRGRSSPAKDLELQRDL